MNRKVSITMLSLMSTLLLPVGAYAQTGSPEAAPRLPFSQRGQNSVIDASKSIRVTVPSSAESEVLKKIWDVPGRTEDFDGDRVIYTTADGSVHLKRLSDGTDTVLDQNP
ncbi:hypothetical protein, partial [Paenibacillus sp. KR2-11]